MPTAHLGPRQHRRRHLGPTGSDAMILLVLVATWSDVCLVSVDCGLLEGQICARGLLPSWHRVWGGGASKSHFSWCLMP